MNQQPAYPQQYPSQAIPYSYPPPNPYNHHTAGFHQYTGRATQSPSTSSASAPNQLSQQQHPPPRAQATSSPHPLQQRLLQHSPQTLLPQAAPSHHLQHHIHSAPHNNQTQTPPQPPQQQTSQQYIRPFLPPTSQQNRPAVHSNHIAQPALNRGPVRQSPSQSREDISDTQVSTSAALRSDVDRPTLPVESRPVLGSGATVHVQPLASVIATANTEAVDDDPEDGEEDNTEVGEPIFQLPPPPESNYASEAALEHAIHAWSLQHGYELVRRASKKNAAGALYKRYYHCSKHGKIANTGKLTDRTRVRTNRKSNRMGCPMSIAAVAVDPSNPAGEWQIRHRKVHHNHGPMEAVTMAGHRRRARIGGVEKAVDGLFAIGTSTTQVLQFLQKTNPSGLFTRTDVANMKLKYKKFGTCVKDEDATRQISGVPSACLSCRAKKQRCDSARPACGSCVATHIPCEYDHEPPPEIESLPNSPRPMMPLLDHDLDTDATRREEHQNPGASMQQNARQILADLQSFQMEHVRPVKLSLQSSSVEILAQSSCGNGDSYKSLPSLQSAPGWDIYCDNMMQAALKENTYDVLYGVKTEPEKPSEGCSVEDWNEYIKQLAIYTRRNSALLGAIWSTVDASFRSRIAGVRSARIAWEMLEEMCSPRGSDQAFRLYLDLSNITLQNSANLRDYIARLEAAHAQLVRLKVTTGERGRNRIPVSDFFSTQVVGSAEAIFPEDQLCLFFMRNLGPDWRRWADNLCASNNIAGFGTGPKIGFQDVTHRAIEFEMMQGRTISGQHR